MPKDPSYVRLVEHMASRTITDISGGSGWTISGGEVQPFPKRPNEARFVRQKLAAGLLESASKAEFDELSKNNARFAKLVEDHGVQEGKIQDLVDEIRGDMESDSDAGEDEPT